MKLNKLALVLVVVLMASAITPVLAKSPFADVPADHWAYDSVVELAAAGLIEGYPDGTYGGSRMMTRYEAAMVFARALHRLEAQIADSNLLPELDKIKAELMAEIEAQMAAADKPVVETRVVEKVIVDKDVDEDTLARIRANEIATEALGGDMAYLEARMLGLIDGIRYDVNKVEEQVTGIEQPSMDEIEALIAARIQESLLDVASGVKETTIVERVVSTTPELTQADVELIAEALIRAQVQKYDALFQENRDLIVGLIDWVEELDADLAVVKDDVEGVKADVAGLKTSVAALEKVKFSGALEIEGKKESGKDYAFTQKGTLNLNLKPSDTTSVKAFLGFDVAAGTLVDKLTNYGVEVKSGTPVQRLIAGKLAKGELAPFGGYVLPQAAQQFGGAAKVKIIDGLTLDLFAGQAAVDPADSLKGAVALRYEFMPELGIRLSGAADKPVGAMFENYAAGIGLFGTVAGVKYTGDFAMDFRAEDKNYIAVVGAETSFDPVDIDVKLIYEEENYKIAEELQLPSSKFGVEAGVGAEFLGINLGGRFYYEGGAAETVPEPKTVVAYKLDADTTFDLFVPVTVAARYAGNKQGEDEARNNIFAKLSVAQKPDLGLRYGAYASYEKNVLTKVQWWDNASYDLDRDEAKFGANVGYGLDWNGAKVDLDYNADFVMPLRPEGESNVLKNKLVVGYGFTDNVKLTLSGDVKTTLADPMANAFGYSAGLKVTF